MPDQPTNAQPPQTVTLQIGQFALRGRAAVAVILGTILLIAVLVVRARPSLANWPMWLSAAIWISFISYWSSAARTAAPMTSRESKESRRAHARMLNGGLLLLFVPLPWLSQRLVAPSPLLTVAGLVIQLSLFGLAIAARRALGRHWSGAIGTYEGHELVRSGPYRVLRHPIYTAMVGMAAGTTLISMTPHAIAGFALVLIAYVRKVRLEEQHLQGVFGERYDEYRKVSWGIVPFVW